MRIEFAEKRLRQLCERERDAQKQLGSDSAKKLKARLADIMAARVVTDLVAGNPHPLKGDRKGQFSVGLAGGRRLVFEPSDDPPESGSSYIDWSSVEAVRIVYIGDYHG